MQTEALVETKQNHDAILIAKLGERPTYLAALLGPEAEVEALVDAESVRTREDDPFIAGVRDVLRRVRSTEPRVGSAPYFTDASALTPAYGGVPTVILGPGELALCHQTDEFCETVKIGQAAEAYLQIARRWCGL